MKLDFSNVASWSKMFSDKEAVTSFFNAALAYLQNPENGGKLKQKGGTNFFMEPGDIRDSSPTSHSGGKSFSVKSSSNSSSGKGPKGIDLSGFGALQLPTGKQGHPDTISGSRLKSYNGAAFQQGNGKITFKVPEGGGVTTAHSKFPRSELREQGTWHMSSGTSKLSATLSVDKLPPNGTVVIGQIHQEVGSGKPRPPVELFYKNGKVYASVMDSNSLSAGRHNVEIATVKNGEKFSYDMKLSPNGQLEVSVNGKSKTVQMDSSFKNSNLYFKAGNYCQDQRGGSEVSFYGLDIQH